MAGEQADSPRRSTGAALTPGEVPIAYYARFGAAGEFDMQLFDPTINRRLMLEALRRDAPITRADLEAVHQELYGRPIGDDPPPGALT